MSQVDEEFQYQVEPLQDIQFDNDEEIKVPILVHLKHPDAEIPRKSHPGSSCYDLKSLETFRLRPKKRHVFNLGFAIKIRKGWMLQIYDRSGLSTIHKVIIPGAPKIIDPDYRGSIYVCLKNEDKKHSHWVRKGDRIAQAAVLRNYSIDFIETECIEMHETSRGNGAFGSTGR